MRIFEVIVPWCFRKSFAVALFMFAMVLQSFQPSITPYKIGDNVSDFSLQNVDGKIVSTADYKTTKGFIIVFTCNHCPFAKMYNDRLNALNKDYSPKGFPLLAISSNDPTAVPEDSYEKMIEFAKEKKYTFPYLFDEKQSVAKVFDASKTPHAFVLLKEHGKLVLKYSGAIDDNGAEPQNVKNRYLENAINQLLAGKVVSEPVTKSIGCAIKWKS